jgi:uncharacterized protein YegL
MGGEPINSLAAGLGTLRESLQKDELARRRVDLAVVKFNSAVEVLQDFGTVDTFQLPTLGAEGQTAMGTAINQALDMVRARKSQYSAGGIAYYRPWIFLITDGEPQGEPDGVFEQACARIKDEEQKHKIAFFAVGVERPGEAADALMARLSLISSVRPPVRLKGLNFKEMFVWLSKSMQKVSSSKPDDQLALPAVNWGTV